MAKASSEMDTAKEARAKAMCRFMGFVIGADERVDEEYVELVREYVWSAHGGGPGRRRGVGS